MLDGFVCWLVFYFISNCRKKNVYVLLDEIIVFMVDVEICFVYSSFWYFLRKEKKIINICWLYDFFYGEKKY